MSHPASELLMWALAIIPVVWFLIWGLCVLGDGPPE